MPSFIGQLERRMGRLTTHVLDIARGVPAEGMAIQLYRDTAGRFVPVADAVTNRDGRCDAPLLEGERLIVGRYRLLFSAGGYFRANGIVLPDPPFVDQVAIDVGIADAGANWHVPLLVSPWSWSTYRGS